MIHFVNSRLNAELANRAICTVQDLRMTPTTWEPISASVTSLKSTNCREVFLTLRPARKFPLLSSEKPADTWHLLAVSQHLFGTWEVAHLCAGKRKDSPDHRGTTASTIHPVRSFGCTERVREADCMYRTRREPRPRASRESRPAVLL